MTLSTDSTADSVSHSPEPVCQPTNEQIALCAYFIYEAEEHPLGRDIEHWLQAEEQLTMCCIHEPASACMTE